MGTEHDLVAYDMGLLYYMGKGHVTDGLVGYLNELSAAPTKLVTLLTIIQAELISGMGWSADEGYPFEYTNAVACELAAFAVLCCGDTIVLELDSIGEDTLRARAIEFGYGVGAAQIKGRFKLDIFPRRIGSRYREPTRHIDRGIELADISPNQGLGKLLKRASDTRRRYRELARK